MSRTSRLLSVITVLVFIFASFPVRQAMAIDQKSEIVEVFSTLVQSVNPAASEIDAFGDWGDILPYDSYESPAVQCQNSNTSSTKNVDIHVITPSIFCSQFVANYIGC